MARKKLPKGLRKRIRQEKARIRREEHSDPKRVDERLVEVYEDLGVVFSSQKNQEKKGEEISVSTG